MNNKYNDLFETIIKSYYEDNFEETIERIMINHEVSPQETFNIICSLCGVNLEFDNNYIFNLKKAITDYQVNTRFIEKLKGCNVDCKKDDNHQHSCQLACPLEAILYSDEDKSVYIDYDKCIGCGICVDHCQDGRILDKVDFIPIMDLIKNNKTVYAAVAPAIIHQFGEDATMDKIREALINVGFTDMMEVAFAADMLTIKEAVEFNNHINDPEDLMITSCCCPIWVGMLKKIYNDLVPNLSPSVSPMIGAGKIIKNFNPEAKVVFIGPCLAKKAEAKEKDLLGIIDFVLTFEEIQNIFNVFEIDFKSLTGIPSKEYASRGGRLYARTGGVSRAVKEALQELYPEKANLFNSIKVDGVKQCKEILNKALAHDINANFIEGMGCIGGCVGGPKALLPKEEGTKLVNEFAFDSSIKVSVHSDSMKKVLKELGINSLDDFEDPYKTAIFHREF